MLYYYIYYLIKVLFRYIYFLIKVYLPYQRSLEMKLN